MILISAGPQLPGAYSCGTMIEIELHEASESVAPHEAHLFVPGTMSTNLQTLKCKLRDFLWVLVSFLYILGTLKGQSLIQ